MPIVHVDQETMDQILASARAAEAKRAADMPTDQDAIMALHQAWQRLKELGWRDSMYMPSDGTECDVIEVGSTGIHAGMCMRDGHGRRTYWVADAGDLWPSSPIVFRPRPALASEARGVG